jgi:hypothetical protein
MSQPEQPDSPHRVVSQALEAGVRNRDWFLWVGVDAEAVPTDLDPLVERTEQWLSQLDPNQDADPEPELEWAVPGLHVSLRALAKKPRARGQSPLVGNPYPAFAYWA